jgi:hypothetical protein
MKVKLKNVVLSYPSLFETTKFDGKDTGKYEATFLISKDATKLIELIEQTIDQCFKEKDFKGKLPADKICFKDGDLKFNSDGEVTSGYATNMFIKVTSKMRVSIVDRNMRPVTEDDDLIKGGAIVNAQLNIWFQDNKWGKRVNAQLENLQYVSKGISFSGESSAREEPENVWEKLDDDFIDEPDF